MVNMERQLVKDRKEAVYDALKNTGVMSYKELASVTGFSYYQVRDSVSDLVLNGLVAPVSGKSGRTIYFTVIGGSRMPSLLGDTGMVPLHRIMEIQLKKPLVSYAFGEYIAEILSLLYSQPMTAKVAGAVSERDMEVVTARIEQLKEMLRKLGTLVSEIENKLIPSDPPVEFANWAEDPAYDREVAISSRQKYAEFSQPVLDAYKELTDGTGTPDTND